MLARSRPCQGFAAASPNGSSTASAASACMEGSVLQSTEARVDRPGGVGVVNGPGTVIEGRRDELVVSPFRRAYREAVDRQRAIGHEFGLTPSGRPAIRPIFERRPTWGKGGATNGQPVKNWARG